MLFNLEVADGPLIGSWYLDEFGWMIGDGVKTAGATESKESSVWRMTDLRKQSISGQIW